MAPTAEYPAECVTDKGYHSRVGLEGARRRPLEEPDLRAQAESVLRAGTEMMRLALAVTNNRTRLLSGVASAKPSSCAPRSSSAPLPTTSIAAVCAGPGFGAARTCTSDTCFTSPATSPRWVADAPTPSAPAPRRRPWRAELAPCSCLLRPLEPSWSFRSSSSSRRMAKPPSPRYASAWRETRSMTPFSYGLLRARLRIGELPEDTSVRLKIE